MLPRRVARAAFVRRVAERRVSSDTRSRRRGLPSGGDRKLWFGRSPADKLHVTRLAPALVAVVVVAVLAGTAFAARSPTPSYAQARTASAKAAPGYVLESCVRGGPRVTCAMYRDAARWRLQRTSTVRIRGGRPVARVTAARRFCRLPPAKRDRCAFRLPKG